MVHRIHRGEALPTVEAAAAANDTTWKYHVIGFRSSDNVYGAVQKNPNPAAGQPPAVTAGVAFPRDLRGCAVCHQPQKDAQGNVVYAAQADEWKTNVSRRTCQSCHDSSWFQDANPPKYHLLHQRATNPTNTGVAGLVQADDSACKTCHSDVLMSQHHTSPFASSAFNPLQLSIDSVTVTTVPGSGTAGAAQVTFTVKNQKDGSPVTDLKTLGSASLNASQLDRTSNDFESSATDRNIATRNVIPTATPVAGQSGTYTDTIALPAGATGTWAVGMEARRVNQALTAQERKLGNLGPTATFNEFAPVNPVVEFDTSKAGTAQTSKTLSRRKVVEVQRCNVCHETLSVHGGLRHSPEYCVMCHTPNNTDVARRPKNAGGAPEDPNATNTAATIDKLPERSIHFKPMIHSIHTGEELSLQRPFVIYGFGSSVNFFDETRFPTSRANCQICHLSGTNTLDSLREDALPTRAMQQGQAVTDANGSVTTGGTLATVPPIQAACLACHDTPEAHAHATVMTQVPTGAPAGTAPVETCRICHGENSEQAVTKMHRQAAARDE
jgi:OmcA/MtrC family decaheme c-type cytochrome